MKYPDIHDNTSADHEQLETELLAQGRDAESVATGDVDDTTARALVNDLVDADVVTPVPQDRFLVHEPSGTAFESTTQLAVFHQGWTAAHDSNVEAE
jgi:hypothetical protein